MNLKEAEVKRKTCKLCLKKQGHSFCRRHTPRLVMSKIIYNVMETELQKMYDSEINVQISSFWDGGWRIALGDRVNGFIHPKWDSCELHEVVSALQELILEHYPNSLYAKSLSQSKEKE